MRKRIVSQATRRRYVQYSTRQRQESRDYSVGHSGKEKSARMDLGLALLSLAAVPGVSYSHREIAAWCGCTDSAILSIEQGAMKKLRNRLFFRDRKTGEQLLETLAQMAKRERSMWERV